MKLWITIPFLAMLVGASWLALSLANEAACYSGCSEHVCVPGSCAGNCVCVGAGNGEGRCAPRR